MLIISQKNMICHGLNDLANSLLIN